MTTRIFSERLRSFGKHDRGEKSRPPNEWYAGDERDAPPGRLLQPISIVFLMSIL